jgi:hypothetical protein
MIMIMIMIMKNDNDNDHDNIDHDDDLNFYMINGKQKKFIGRLKTCFVEFLSLKSEMIA